MTPPGQVIVMPLLPGRPGGTRSRPGQPGSHPARLAEFAELHDAYVAEVELPGVGKNQMRIELAGRDLVISAQPAAPAPGCGRRAGSAAPSGSNAGCRCPARPTPDRSWRHWPTGR